MNIVGTVLFFSAVFWCIAGIVIHFVVSASILGIYLRVYLCLCVYVCICAYVCMCVCMCVYGAISLLQCDTKINKKIVEELNDIHDVLIKVLGKDTAPTTTTTTPPPLPPPLHDTANISDTTQTIELQDVERSNDLAPATPTLITSNQ